MKDAHAVAQPADAPPIVVGMHVEVLTGVTGESGNDYKHWLPGVVTLISDGSQVVTEHLPAKNVKKRGKKGEKGPRGWVCVLFDDGFEDWYPMSGDNFNNRALRSWRVDLDFGQCGTDAAAEIEST